MGFMALAYSALDRFLKMGLFTKREPAKTSSLDHIITVEDISYEEFERLMKWVNENIPSTERFTPKWNSDFDLNSPMDDYTDKIHFRFRHEEQAMAFKLIL